MKRIILLLLFVCVCSIAQNRPNRSFFWEANPIISNDTAKVYVSYQIPYEQLVFVRDNGSFKAGIKFFIEAVSDKGDIVFRGFDEREVETNRFENTNSSNKYLNGLLVFEAPATNLKLSPEIEISSVKRTFKPPSKSININSVDSISILQPLSVKVKMNQEESGIYLNNFSGSIPFSKDKISLLVPITNYSENEIIFEIYEKDKKLKTNEVSKVFSGIMEIKLLENELKVVEKENNQATSYYLIKDINYDLTEGAYEIRTEIDGKVLTKSFEIIWVRKPRSLYNVEYAIEILELIEKEEVVRELLDNDEEQYSKALSDYWLKYDRNKETKFNEVMNEFYTRVDSADVKFSVVKTERGSKTDRGKIYIKFGKPDSVMRTYSASNQIIETWLYDRINKKFYFTDRSGLGDFTIMN